MSALKPTWIAVALLVGAALSACSTPTALLRDDAPSAAATAAPCGRDISGVAGLLEARDLPAPARSTIGRSAAGWTFSAAACGHRPSRDIPSASCDPLDFPWATSPSEQNTDLFSRGARTLRLATFEIDAKPVLREVVLEAAAGSSLAQTYRRHLSSCGANVVATANGRIGQAALPGHTTLVVAFVDDTRIVALQGLVGQRTDELNLLTQTAIGRT